MKIKEDVLKQLLTKISQLESRIVSLEGSVSSLERFNNRDTTDPSYWQQSISTGLTECGSTSTYPTRQAFDFSIIPPIRRGFK